MPLCSSNYKVRWKVETYSNSSCSLKSILLIKFNVFSIDPRFHFRYRRQPSEDYVSGAVIQG
jgi:hypothetical protein